MTAGARRGAALGVALWLAAAPAAAGVKWEPLPADRVDAGDCPKEPGCPAAVVWEETLLDNSYLNARVEVHRIVKIFKPDGLKKASFSIPYVVGEWSVKDLEGRTIRPDGSVADLDPRSAIVQTVVKASGFRGKELQVEMPAAEVGALLEYRYRQIHAYQFGSYEWQPQEDVPILRSTLLVKGASLWQPIAVNMEGIKKAMDVDAEGRTRIVLTDVPSLPDEPLMPPAGEVRGRILLAGPTPPLWTWSRVGGNVHDYFEKYYSRSKQARRLTEELLRETTDPEVKLQKLYAWVQDNIDNTSFQETREGEVESEHRNIYVDDVLASRQGTFEDLVRLFVFMAREAGFDASVALVATRDEAFFRKDLRDVSQLNGEVAAVHQADEWKFFDPGTRYIPFGLVGWQNEGVWENAVITRPASGILVRIPPSPAAGNLHLRRVRVRLGPGGAMSGEVQEEAHGLTGAAIRNDVDHLGDGERRARLQDDLGELREGVKVADLAYANREAWGEPLRAAYRVEAGGYAVPAGTRLLVPAIAFPFHNPLHAPERRTDVYFERTVKRVEEMTLEVPERYEVESLPAPDLLDLGKVRYNINFQQVDGEVRVTRSLTNDVVLIDVDHYGRIRELLDEATRLDASQIVLRRAAGAEEAGP